jgi:hypothetical protein
MERVMGIAPHFQQPGILLVKLGEERAKSEVGLRPSRRH